MNNLQRKFQFYKMLREVAKGKSINEFYYQNSEGQNFSDYDLWSQAVKTKYPQSEILKEWDTDVAIDNKEQVAFWDDKVKQGVVYDLNLAQKENHDTFQTAEFTPEEIKQIQTIVPEATVADSGLVSLGNYALLKFRSGIIELVKKLGDSYNDFKTFNNMIDLQKNLKKSILIQKYESVTSNEFNIEGFKENMSMYVNEIEKYIDYDQDQDVYFVSIPFTALKQNSTEIANKIVKIAELYPRCLSAHVEWAKNELRFVFSNRSYVKESTYHKLVLEYAHKDEMRIRDIIAKSGKLDTEVGGVSYNNAKQIQLATNMANAITDMYKAFNRGAAAADILGKDSEIAQIFFKRAKELGYPVETELAKPKIVTKKPGSQLPPEQRFVNKYKNDRLGHRGGNPILPCGSLNFTTGENKYFNVREDNDGTIEVWKTSDNTYKAVITSGKNPLHEIGERAEFEHDQTSRHLFTGTMIDYINVDSMEQLIHLYGKSMMCYVYK